MLLLAAYGIMSFTASLSKGVSFDEGQQLAVGYNLWLRDDYRIEGANGDLVKRWATLPFLVSKPRFVSTDDPLWLRGEPYEIAHRFLFELGNRPESLLAQGRAMPGFFNSWNKTLPYPLLPGYYLSRSLGPLEPRLRKHLSGGDAQRGDLRGQRQ